MVWKVVQSLPIPENDITDVDEWIYLWLYESGRRPLFSQESRGWDILDQIQRAVNDSTYPLLTHSDGQGSLQLVMLA